MCAVYTKYLEEKEISSIEEANYIERSYFYWRPSQCIRYRHNYHIL